MRRRIWLRLSALTLGVLLAATATCRAQVDTAFDDNPYAQDVEIYRGWVRLEYLLWQIQAAPLPPYLLFNNTGATEYGGSQDYGWMNGARLSSGLWYDYEDRIGAEVSFFMLGAHSEYDNFSPPNNSSVALPYYNAVNNKAILAKQSLVANANQSASVDFENAVRFLGGNLDFVFVPVRNNFFELNVLCGFTSVWLKEGFAQNANTTTSTAAKGVTTTKSVSTYDDFDTQNVFYGAELGLRGIFRYQPFFLELTGRLGVGANMQIVDISGQTVNATTVAPPGTTTTSTSGTGFLAQTTNEGNYSRNEFCVLPQFQLRIGVDLTSNLQLSVGYDYLYLTNVVRPGNQIDQIMGNINGTTHPIFPFNASGFFAQGLNIGLELKF